MQRKFNIKLFLCSVASCGILAMAVHWVHSQQMRSNAGEFNRQADRAIQHNEFAKAAELLRLYLTYHPNDTEAIARYAAALERSAASPRARFRVYLLLEQVLRRQPNQLDARTRAVQAAIDVGRTEDAIRHIEYLIAHSGETAELRHRLGWCQEALGLYEESARSFRRALTIAPHQIESYLLLAELLARNLKDPQEAASVMDAMITANPKSWQAFMARARFHFGNGLLTAAASDVFIACDLAPRQDEVLAAGAEMALLQGDFPRAQNYINRGLQVNPKNEHLYRALSSLAKNSDRADEAIAALQAGLEVVPEAFGLRVGLAELLLDQGKEDEARDILMWLRNNKAPLGLEEYLEGRLMMLENCWPQAIVKLTSARAKLTTAASDWASNICLSLGKCHGAIGEFDKQLAACRDAVALDQTNVTARLLLSKSLLSADLPHEASMELRRLAALPKPPAETWLLTARALIGRAKHQAAVVQDWSQFDAVLAKAESAAPNDAELVVVRAQSLLLRGQHGGAIALLEKAREQRPDEARFWVALAEMQAELGRDAEALITFENARKKLGTRSEVCQALTRYWSARPGLQARTILNQTLTDIATLPAGEKVLLLRELAASMSKLNDHVGAELALRQLAALLPTDLDSRGQLFDLALNSGRDRDAAAIISELRNIEGDEGVLWRAGEAARGIAKARMGDKSLLASSRKRLAEIRQLRGEVARAVLLEASVEELDGRNENAIALYLRAIELGQRPPSIVLDVAKWLADRHRFTEATTVLRQLDNQMPLPPEHLQLAIEVALQSDDLKWAVTLATQAVPDNLRDGRELLWLAHVQWLAGHPNEATETLLKASQAAPRNPEVWITLARHFARIQQPKHLDDVFKEMLEKTPADRAAITLARCLEAAGRLKEAEKCFAKLVSENANDPVSTRQFAEFHLRTHQIEKAEPLLRSLVANATKTPLDLTMWARRHLALALALRDQPGGAQEALALLARNAGPKGLHVEDERVACFVLSRIAGRQFEAARRFEATLKDQPLSPQERFLLVQIYVAQGDEDKAAKEMGILLAIQRDNPSFLAYHVQRLLQQSDRNAARTYLGMLEALEPSSPRTLQLKSAVGPMRTN